MNLEIHEPELERRARAYIKSGRFHDTDELLSRAFDALDEKDPEQTEGGTPPRKSFVELCDPVRGFAEDIDFSRNPSKARSLNL